MQSRGFRRSVLYSKKTDAEKRPFAFISQAKSPAKKVFILPKSEAKKPVFASPAEFAASAEAAFAGRRGRLLKTAYRAKTTLFYSKPKGRPFLSTRRSAAFFSVSLFPAMRSAFFARVTAVLISCRALF
jgi:hypothetical protein